MSRACLCSLCAALMLMLLLRVDEVRGIQAQWCPWSDSVCINKEVFESGPVRRQRCLQSKYRVCGCPPPPEGGQQKLEDFCPKMNPYSDVYTDRFVTFDSRLLDRNFGNCIGEAYPCRILGRDVDTAPWCAWSPWNAWSKKCGIGKIWRMRQRMCDCSRDSTVLAKCNGKKWDTDMQWDFINKTNCCGWASWSRWTNPCNCDNFRDGSSERVRECICINEQGRKRQSLDECRGNHTDPCLYRNARNDCGEWFFTMKNVWKVCLLIGAVAGGIWLFRYIRTRRAAQQHGTVHGGGAAAPIMPTAPAGSYPTQVTYAPVPQQPEGGQPPPPGGYPEAPPGGYAPAGAPPPAGYPQGPPPTGYAPVGAPPPTGYPAGHPPAGYPPAGAPPPGAYGYPPAGAPPPGAYGYPPPGAPPMYPSAEAPPATAPPSYSDATTPQKM